MTDIKTLNDTFRQTFTGGRVMLTAGINAKSQDDIAKILSEVRRLIILPKLTIHTANMTLEVLTIKVKKSFGKLIIMTRIINICQRIQAIQK